MGHYDDAYEAEAEKYREQEKQRAQEQLKLMDKFRRHLVQGPGVRGISTRHLEAFEDMVNETKLRTR